MFARQHDIIITSDVDQVTLSTKMCLFASFGSSTLDGSLAVCRQTEKNKILEFYSPKLKQKSEILVLLVHPTDVCLGVAPVQFI